MGAETPHPPPKFYNVLAGKTVQWNLSYPNPLGPGVLHTLLEGS